ncbi:MAG: RCC1 domain-containing protein, partial [Fimbriimonas sp.]
LTWGSNERSQLGLGTGSAKITALSTPTVVQNLPNSMAVAAGGTFTLALTGDNEVYGWGENTSSQLGANVGTRTAIPTRNPNIGGVVAIAAGFIHSLALKEDGTVWGWGNNAYGQLGNGNKVSGPVPQQVLGLTNVVQIAAGGYRSFAVKSDGTVWVWGDSAVTASQVAGLSLIRQVSTSGYHNVAVRDDGMIMTWGRNDVGQLGIPSAPQTWAGLTTPTLVPGVDGIASAVAGGTTTIAIDVDGNAFVAGRTDGFTKEYKSASFIQPPNLEKVFQAAAGTYHSLLISQTEAPVWAMMLPRQIISGRTTARLKVTNERMLDHDLSLPLSSSVPGVVHPANVTIPSGIRSVQVELTHPEAVANYEPGVMSVSAGAVGASTSFEVAPATLTLMFYDTYGGDMASANARINFPAPPGGMVVNLSCNKPSVVQFPASVTIPEGAYVVPIPAQTAPTATLRIVDFAGSTPDGIEGTGRLYIIGNGLGWIRFNKAEVQGGEKVGITARIPLPAPAGGTVVHLMQGGNEFIMPESLTVPEGETIGRAIVETKPIPQHANMPITAYVDGSYPKVGYLKVLAGVPQQLVASNPTPVGGSSVTMTLHLTSASAGQSIALVSSSALLTIPSSVVVPAGSSSVTFTAQTSAVSEPITVSMKAKHLGTYVQAALALKLPPPALEALTIEPNEISGAGTLVGKVLLAGPAPAGGAYVALKSSTALASVPAYVKVAEGNRSAKFTITTSATTVEKVVTITGMLEGTQAFGKFRLKP